MPRPNQYMSMFQIGKAALVLTSLFDRPFHLLLLLLWRFGRPGQGNCKTTCWSLCLLVYFIPRRLSFTCECFLFADPCHDRIRTYFCSEALGENFDSTQNPGLENRKCSTR